MVQRNHHAVPATLAKHASRDAGAAAPRLATTASAVLARAKRRIHRRTATAIALHTFRWPRGASPRRSTLATVNRIGPPHTGRSAGTASPALAESRAARLLSAWGQARRLTTKPAQKAATHCRPRPPAPRRWRGLRVHPCKLLIYGSPSAVARSWSYSSHGYRPAGDSPNGQQSQFVGGHTINLAYR